MSALLIISLTLAACGGGGKGSFDTSVTTGPSDEVTTPSETSDTRDNDSQNATGPAVSYPAESEPTEVLEVVWHFGYVGSSSHASYAYAINPTGGYYSYTDVITIPRAGTEISFRDDNTNSGGDINFASGSAFVISSWKQERARWVIDRDGVNIAGSNNNPSLIATPEGNAVVYRYVTSKDNENIRLCFRSGQTSSFTPAAYPEVTLRYTGAPGTMTDILEAQGLYDEWIEQSKLSSYYKELEGLTLYAIGDSYFAGDALETKYVWCSLLAAKYGMTYSNKGANGSTVSDYVTTNSPMVSRYTALPAAGADIILLEGGKNDFNQNVPIGENSDTTTKTYKGALNYLITKLQERYPSAIIICVTPWNVNATNSIGKKVTDYAAAMVEVAAHRGVPCFNAADVGLSGVDMNSPTFRSTYCLSANDISHLNFAGHRMVLPTFEKFIYEVYKAK